MDCQIDAFLYQIYNHPSNDYIYDLHNYYYKMRDYEIKYNQCKSICLTRKEEIYLDLIRWVDLDEVDSNPIE